MPWAALGGAAASLGGGIIGAMSQNDARAQAERLISESVNDLKGVGLPQEEALRISLEKYRSQGLLTPEMESDILQGRTEMEGIQTDPRLKDAQMASLDELRRVGENGGMRLSDKAAMEQNMGDISAQERGSREAILMDQAQRGASTGGGALAAQLLNQQESAGRQHDAGMFYGGKAQDAALQAIMQSGQLAGDIRGQEFGEQEKIKSAQDVINQMNTQARQGVQQRNVGQRNYGQEYNLGNSQNMANANVDTANKEQIYNHQIPQQMFQNEMTRAQSLSNARAGQASNAVAGGNAAGQMWGNIGGGLGQIGMGYASKQMDAEERDKDREAGYSPYAITKK